MKVRWLTLLQEFPEAGQHRNKDGADALHFACHYEHSEQVVLKLLHEYPPAAKGLYQTYPLELACEFGPSEKDAFPEAVGKNGCSPLIDAIKNKQSENAVLNLIALTLQGTKSPSY